MRLALALFLTLACALPAAAQPAAGPAADRAPAVAQAATPAKTETGQRTAPAVVASNNPEADAALAVAIRQREAQERLLQMACAAGDTSKCQPANASTTARTPSP